MGGAVRPGFGGRVGGRRASGHPDPVSAGRPATDDRVSRDDGQRMAAGADPGGADRRGAAVLVQRLVARPAQGAHRVASGCRPRRRATAASDRHRPGGWRGQAHPVGTTQPLGRAARDTAGVHVAGQRRGHRPGAAKPGREPRPGAGRGRAQGPGRLHPATAPGVFDQPVHRRKRRGRVCPGPRAKRRLAHAQTLSRDSAGRPSRPTRPSSGSPPPKPRSKPTCSPTRSPCVVGSPQS